jgi:Big-like domain-containing protein
MSCASPGNCSAGGSYSNTTGFTYVFVVSEVNGTWGTAEEIPGTAALDQEGDAAVTSMSCTSPGNCSAGGRYLDSQWHAFVVDQVNGTWDTAEEVPGTTSGQLLSLSCSSGGNCTAGGFTTGSGEDATFAVSEVNGTWGTAETVPGTSGGGEVLSVSCPSADFCIAGGDMFVLNSGDEAFTAEETGGTWGAAQEVPGTGALNEGGNAGMTSVSCASAGNCSAGGYYRDSTGNDQVFVDSEGSDTWGTAEEIPGSGALNQGGAATVTSMSCPSAGNCAAGGYYTGRPGTTNGGDINAGEQAFVVSEANGTWGTTEEVPGTASLNLGQEAQVTSVSCGSVSSCSAGGYYEDSSYNAHAFLVDESNGTWGTEIDVPGTTSGQTGAVSCPSAGNCAAGGTYSSDTVSGEAFVISQTPTQDSATALNLSPVAVAYGNEQAEQVSVTVSSAGTPTGTVTVAAGTTTLCTITLVSAAGSCTLQATQLPAGTYQVTGSYSGDADTSPSVSPAQALTVQSQAPTSFTIISSTTYAGWSVHPSGGLVHSVQAQWTVPSVTCGTPATRPWYTSRAAVWAGMWGPASGISTTDWLPQAGTISECFFGVPIYVAFYELEAAENGNKPVVLPMLIRAGDTIQATVTYTKTNSANQLIFSYSITDISLRNDTDAGQMPPTSKGVQLSAAAYQGGVIVENEPTGTITDCVTRSICLSVPVGGLSKFASPISVNEPFTTVNGAGLQTYSGFDTLYRWDLISSSNSTEKLADTGPVTSNGFSVTWENYL